MAAGQFMIGKPGVAPLHQALQSRVVGLQGLNPNLPRPVRPPGPSGHLNQQLGGALRRLEVRAQEAGVRIDGGHQGDVGEVVALGQHLGADKNARLTSRDLRQLPLQTALGAGGVAVDADQGEIRESGSEGGLRSFGAGPHCGELSPPAGWANRRRRLFRAAMVAGQQAAAQMQRQAGVASVAEGLPAAGGAQVYGRIAAPVQEHQHLAPSIEVAGNALQQRLAQAVLQPVPANVENLNARQRGAGGAARQNLATVAPAAHILQGLQGRRGAAQNQRDVQILGPLDGDVPSRIAQPILLLERSVVLLIHHDQPQLLEGREHRRAGADQNARRTVPATQPGGQPLLVAQTGMQHIDGPVTALEAGDGLRRQDDFRHQHQRLLAVGEHLADHLQIDLGFAAAGDALQQVGGEPAQRTVVAGNHPLLVWGQRQGPLQFVGTLPRPEGALLDQRRDHGGGESGRADGGAAGPTAATVKKLQQRPLARGAAKVRRNAGNRQPNLLRAATERGTLQRRVGQHGGEHFADGMVVVGRQPTAQTQQVLR